MSLLDDLKAEEEKLRGIKAPRGEGAGHAFKKSGLSKRLRGESDKAPCTSTAFDAETECCLSCGHRH